MATCDLCRGEAETLADAAMAVVQPELDRLRPLEAPAGQSDQPDRCARCLCSDCGGRLDEHTETGCSCEDCTISPEYACSLAEFAPSERISILAQQLGPLLSVHLGPKQQRRCLAVAHAAHHALHALHDYDYPEEIQS